MGIYYRSIDHTRKEFIDPPKAFSIKFPGIISPSSPFPNMLLLANALGNDFQIENDMRDDFYVENDGYQDKTEYYYEKLKSYFPNYDFDKSEWKKESEEQEDISYRSCDIKGLNELIRHKMKMLDLLKAQVLPEKINEKDKYSLESLIEIFLDHTYKVDEDNAKNLINYMENNPNSEIPENLKDTFNLPLALHAICLEIRSLKDDIEELH